MVLCALSCGGNGFPEHQSISGKTKHYDSIAYPIYMNVVNDADEFVMESLVSVLRHEYVVAFNTYLALAKSDDIFALLKSYRDVP